MSGVEVLGDLEMDEKTLIIPERNEVEEGDEKSEGNESDSGDSWIVVEKDKARVEDEAESEVETEIRRTEEMTSNEESDSSSSTQAIEEEFSLEDLPLQYPKIQKGLNYSHKPNRELNVILTASVVLGLAVALGFGLGHFLGWSERLDEVSSILPSDEEAILIEQLKSENEELRMSINEANVLRNQIETLMRENSELEREIEKLRLNRELVTENLASQKSIDELRFMLDQTNSLLRETKENLNDITSENEILKIEVGKARYGKPTLPVEERERIDRLILENEELKQEVKKIRSNIPSGHSSSHEDMPLPRKSCFSWETEEQDDTPPYESKYFNYIKNFVQDSTQKTYKIMEEAKVKFDSKLKPGLKNMGQKFFDKYYEVKDFAQNSNTEEKVQATLRKLGESFDSFVGDLTFFASDMFMGKEQQHFEPDYASSGEEEVPPVGPGKGDHSWYFQRGKGREFSRQENGDEVFFYNKASTAARDKTTYPFIKQKPGEDDNKKYHSKKAFKEQKNLWKRHNKRFRGD